MDNQSRVNEWAFTDDLNQKLQQLNTRFALILSVLLYSIWIYSLSILSIAIFYKSLRDQSLLTDFNVTIFQNKIFRNIRDIEFISILKLVSRVEAHETLSHCRLFNLLRIINLCANLNTNLLFLFQVIIWLPTYWTSSTTSFQK